MYQLHNKRVAGHLGRDETLDSISKDFIGLECHPMSIDGVKIALCVHGVNHGQV